MELLLKHQIFQKLKRNIFNGETYIISPKDFPISWISSYHLNLIITSNVTDMGNLFEGKRIDEDISSWDVSKVINMKNMFRQSQGHENFTVSNWDVSNVTNMEAMFEQAGFNLDISNWNVGKVTNMRNTFAKNSDFNQDIGNWDVSNVTDMYGMFRNSVFDKDLNNWDVSNVLNMQEMF